jgi:hypothetical protein
LVLVRAWHLPFGTQRYVRRPFLALHECGEAVLLVQQVSAILCHIPGFGFANPAVHQADR